MKLSKFTILVLLGTLSAASIAKISPVAELHKVGLYGRVHAWNNRIHTSHGVDVVVPQNAPIITSDFHSRVGSNGLKRSGKHRGVDIFAETGTPVIAAADGRVVRARIDKCWGPTILVSHGLDKNNRPFYGLYGHVRNIRVREGQKVKRGQQIAEMGEDIFTSCGAGVHHLHFQISYNPRRIPLFGWGWANFVMDGVNAPNPHKYWENGEGKITCFKEGKKYSASGLTYPVPCANFPGEKSRISGTTRFAGENLEQIKLRKTLLLSLEKALDIEKKLSAKKNISLSPQPIVTLQEENAALGLLKNKPIPFLEGLWAEQTQPVN